MRTRTLITSLSLLVFLTICLIPAICDEAAVAEKAPPAAAAPATEPAAAPEAAKPAEPATAEPAKAEAEVAPAKPSALAVPDTAPVVTVKEGDAPAAAAIPDVAPDTDVFRRTPKIDGVVEDGEWDVFYTYTSGDLEITTFVNWDSSNLYIAARANKPIDLLALLDANRDGWYNGEDNYEFRFVRAAEGPGKLIVNRFDSRNAKSPTATAVTSEEAATVEMKDGIKDGISSVEMRVPATLIRGLKLGDNRKLGMLITARTGSDEAAWISSGSPGDVQELTLVSKKFASLEPLDVGFDIRDTNIAVGDELVAKFHMTNTGPETLNVQSCVIAGEGKAGAYLSSQKVRMDGLPPKKHISREIRSVIPQDMPVGSWALGAEVLTANGKLGSALLSFEVVEPYLLSVRVPVEPVRPTVKDVTLSVVITNNTRSRVRGEAMITLPEGWEIWKDEPKRNFSASNRSFTTVQFKAKPPLGASGKIPVKFDVSFNGKTMTISDQFTMANE
ncbi:MAG: hypothetical protein ACOX3G_03235 [Armatimonadota bacterium]